MGSDDHRASTVGGVVKLMTPQGSNTAVSDAVKDLRLALDPYSEEPNYSLLKKTVIGGLKSFFSYNFPIRVAQFRYAQLSTRLQKVCNTWVFVLRRCQRLLLSKISSTAHIQVQDKHAEAPPPYTQTC